MPEKSSGSRAHSQLLLGYYKKKPKHTGGHSSPALNA